MYGLASWTRAGILLALLGALGLSACSMMSKDNRRVLNLMDKGIQPKSAAARVALAPPAVAVATLGLALDAAVVHPVHELPDAWDDVYQLYWKPRNYDILRKAILFPPIVVLTPPTFAGDWVLRVLFPISSGKGGAS